MFVHFTLKSKNEKTGAIPVSTTSADTCPSACPFKRDEQGVNGCYADGGPLGMHWQKVTKGARGDAWSNFLERVAKLPAGQLWRHNQAGDLPGNGETIDAARLAALAEANRGRRGFTYTHYVPEGGNAEAIATANAAGFTVNLSANTLQHADALADTGIGPVVVVLPSDVDGAVTKTVTTPAGRTVSVCPATYRDDVTCASCGLCQVQARKTIVGFPAHGASKKRASAVAAA